MRLRTAIDEYKRAAGDRFPEEQRTGAGSFAGHGDRLVHVTEDGSLRDYSDSLSGLYGIDRSRLGIVTNDRVEWFDDFETIRQHYYRETRLVETEYDAGSFTVHQYDLTLGRTHATHVELRGTVPRDAKLAAFVTLSPGGRDSGVGALVHEAGPESSPVLEVHHRREHDYLAASTGLAEIEAQTPERFTELLADTPTAFPRSDPEARHDRRRLTGDFLVTAPLERTGRSNRTTLLSRVTRHDDGGRTAALSTLREQAGAVTSADALRSAARDRTVTDVPDATPRAGAVRADLRVLELLSAPDGGRIAAPEFDPFYANSGGYGYVWFRDEAEVGRHVLAGAAALDIDVTERLVESARFLCSQQRSDGTWPHRVWADTGSVAPGWANARVEQGRDSPAYQADQTASVTAFLATLLRERESDLPPTLRVAVRETVADALGALRGDLAADGLPEPCQNLWEEVTGRFTHTAATFLEAFAAVARAPLADDLRARARESAGQVLDGLSPLWNESVGAYVFGLREGDQDQRLDSGALVLARAVCEYDRVEDADLPAAQIDRLATHVATTIDTLWRDPDESDVAGLIRYEDDDWRRREHSDEKVWSVSTGLGVLAAAQVGVLLSERGRDAQRFFDLAGDLYERLAPDGPLTTPAGYLAEQVFDDGTPDSAAPLGWSHALRFHATGLLADCNALPTTATRTEGPAAEPTWTTGEKHGLGTVADHEASEPSRVWFTLTDGALTEARFPRVDLMNLRTLDFLVVDPDTGYAVRTHREDRRSDDTVERRVEPVDDESLSYRHVFTEAGDGQGHEWTLTVDYAADPAHDAVLAATEFTAIDDRSYAVYAVTDVLLTSPTAADRGSRHGESGDYHLAARSPRAYTGTAEDARTDADGDAYSVALAVAAADGFEWASVEAGGSERLDRLYATGDSPEPVGARTGENVVLVGRLGTGRAVGETLAVGFARRADTAAALGEADGALSRGFETVSRDYANSWSRFLEDVSLPAAVAEEPALAAQYRTALMGLRAVEDKTYDGAAIASPSVPWGDAVPASEATGYGYNFVWTRDLYHTFTAFLAADRVDLAKRQLEFVYRHQQDESGFIPQNTFVDGTTRWGGEQMDNVAFPAVMAYQLARAGVDLSEAGYDYEHVRRSADYVARHGPETAQERWEEEAGYSPSSLAAEIAGLACAAWLAERTGHRDDALVWLALADHWANNVETWTVTNTGTARHTNTPYYLRIVRNGDPDAGEFRRLANDGPTLDERDVIDAGFLELVRLGIVPADDPVVRNSVREVDDTIRVDTADAAAFYRYNGDGYGEQARDDPGGPWTLEHRGSGRLWPLLTGERGEFALRRSDPDLAPEDCLRAMASFANDGRLLPEQVWDRHHETDYGWQFGQGTGSATPLSWAMAQYVRLAHGVSAGDPVETPAILDERYREAALHVPEESPALRVDTQFRGNELVVTGETTGDCVAMKTDADGAFVTVDDGQFEETLAIEPGENQVVVAAADDTDLLTARTTVWELLL